MKKKSGILMFSVILIIILAIANPGFLLFADVISVNEVSENSVEDNSDEVNEEVTDNILYREGDEPYAISYNSQIIGYNILHKDGSFDVVGSGEMDQFLLEYGKSNNVSDATFRMVTAEEFYMLLTQKVQNNYATTEDFLYNFATLVDTYKTFAENIDFQKIEHEGSTYYIFKNEQEHYFKITEQTYFDYINYQREHHAEVTKRIQEYQAQRGFGYGTLDIHVTPGESLLGEVDYYSDSIYLLIISEAGDEFSCILNPPTYNYLMQLDFGKYYISKAYSVEHPDESLTIDSQSVFVPDGGDVKVSLTVKRAIDDFEGAEYTKEEKEQAVPNNRENIYVDYYGDDVSEATIPISESENDIIEVGNQKNKWISRVLLIVFFTSLLGYYIYKKYLEK